MKLTKDHRASLIGQLESINEKIERRKVTINNSTLSDEAKCCLEIDLFLAEQQAALIRKSLIDNEIDF